MTKLLPVWLLTLAFSLSAQTAQDDFIDGLFAPGDGDPAFEALLDIATEEVRVSPSTLEEIPAELFFDEIFDQFTTPTWKIDGSSSVGIGWTDNVLRADNGNVGDYYGYFRSLNSFERLPSGTDTPDFVALALFEAKQLSNTEFADNEVFALLQGEWAGSSANGIGYLLPISYVFIDQIYDRTLRELEPIAGRIQLNLLQATPGIRFPLERGWHARVSGRYARSFYALEDEDYYDQGLEVEFFGPLWKRSTLGVEFAQKERCFYSRNARDARGRSFPEPVPLAFRYWDIEAYVKHHWTKSVYTNFSVNGRVRRDNSSGYYDYYRVGSSLQAGWIGDRLELHLTAAYFRDQFTVQETRVGGPLLTREDFEMETEFAWRLTNSFNVFIAGQLLYSESSDVARRAGRIEDITSVMRARDVLIGARVWF